MKYKDFIKKAKQEGRKHIIQDGALNRKLTEIEKEELYDALGQRLFDGMMRRQNA